MGGLMILNIHPHSEQHFYHDMPQTTWYKNKITLRNNIVYENKVYFDGVTELELET